MNTERVKEHERGSRREKKKTNFKFMQTSLSMRNGFHTKRGGYFHIKHQMFVHHIYKYGMQSKCANKMRLYQIQSTPSYISSIIIYKLSSFTVLIGVKRTHGQRHTLTSMNEHSCFTCVCVCVVVFRYTIWLARWATVKRQAINVHWYFNKGASDEIELMFKFNFFLTEIFPVWSDFCSVLLVCFRFLCSWFIFFCFIRSLFSLYHWKYHRIFH